MPFRQLDQSVLTAINSKELLRHLYWDQQLSAAEIGQRVGCSADVIFAGFRRLGIATRSRSDARKLASSRPTIKKRPVTSELKDVLRCHSCPWIWKRTKDATKEECPMCGAFASTRVRASKSEVKSPVKLQALLAYKKANPNASSRQTRLRVLMLVGRGIIACVRCGCDVPAFLEINHKFGGGSKEYAELTSAKLYLQITSLKRDLDDLELLCKVCNALHALELKHGPQPFTVSYEKDATR